MPLNNPTPDIFSMNKIKLIWLGLEKDCYVVTTDKTSGHAWKVDEIKEEQKQISNDKQVTVYRGYIGGKLDFEVIASGNLLIKFWE